MNNSKLDSDNYTRELVNRVELGQASANFSENVMSEILKSSVHSIDKVTESDKRNNMLLFISLAVMILGYLSFVFINNGFSLSKSISSVQYQYYLKLITELNINPYILLSLVGVILIVVIDKIVDRKVFLV